MSEPVRFSTLHSSSSQQNDFPKTGRGEKLIGDPCFGSCSDRVI